jgi:hypothetical protein
MTLDAFTLLSTRFLLLRPPVIIYTRHWNRISGYEIYHMVYLEGRRCIQRERTQKNGIDDDVPLEDVLLVDSLEG